MRFSLLIATLNRPILLKQCITSLLNQTYTDYEIIIIDQSDTNNVITNITSLDKKIRYYHIDVKGLSHARNFGIKKANGNYIILIDDDGIYEARFLERIDKKLYSIKPAILGVQLKDPISQDLKYGINSKRVGYKDAFKCFCSPGMTIRNDFQKQHLYDEQFGVGSIFGSGEETDLILAALKEKEIVYYASDIIVQHPIDKINDINLSKLKSYAYGYGALLRKMFQRYSKFWSLYFLAKTVFGNYVLGFLPLYKNDALRLKRIHRARETFIGFIDYSKQ